MTTRVPPAKCSERSIQLYVDGELDASQALAIEEHLGACEPCRAKIDLSEAVRRSLRRSASRKVPPEMADRLRARFGAVELSASATSGELPQPRWSASDTVAPGDRQASRAQTSRWQMWVGAAGGLAAEPSFAPTGATSASTSK